jgi:hypothetical protein
VSLLAIIFFWIAPTIVDGKWKKSSKIFSQKSFLYILFGHLWVLKFATCVVGSGSKFAAGVIDIDGKISTSSNETSDTDGKFTAIVVDTSCKFPTGVVDTGCKFATSVIDTSGVP